MKLSYEVEIVIFSTYEKRSQNIICPDFVTKIKIDPSLFEIQHLIKM